MAVCISHVLIICTFLFAYFLVINAEIGDNVIEKSLERNTPWDTDEKSSYVTFDESNPQFTFDGPIRITMSLRGAKKVIRPRVTRMGLNLLAARGYGKRSEGEKVVLLTARGYGKRNEEKLNKLLCIINKCKTTENLFYDDMIQPRNDKEVPQIIPLAGED
ncbi:hypothetical protein ABEB36_002667 [Hypothenemus hampei]|uniref:Uncharacterized protein n=1 Tax=Hypothenemus hampei TaxID=57062 RepID=A0ABD1F6L3_HYPHA